MSYSRESFGRVRAEISETLIIMSNSCLGILREFSTRFVRRESIVSWDYSLAKCSWTGDNNMFPEPLGFAEVLRPPMLLLLLLPKLLRSAADHTRAPHVL